GFDLDDHEIIDKHVNAIAQFNSESFVDDGKDLLAFDSGAHSREFKTKALPIRPLEQPWTKSGMHAISGTQNAVGSVAVDEPCASSVRVRALRVGAFYTQQTSQM